MNTKMHICQNCKQSFVIEAEDFVFYERIKVPAPTFCHLCRLQRRLVWRNEYIFSRRKCDAPGHDEQVITIHDARGPMKRVYDQKYWWSDEWDAMEYGRAYDFSKPFFEQFRELLTEVPRASLLNNYAAMVRSEYSNWAGDIKDSYLITDADTVENSAYGSGVFKCKDCVDCDAVSSSELCYDSFNLNQCYRSIGCVNCHECADAYFSKGCVGCSSVFGCINVRKKSYCIFNVQYTKDEYEMKVKELFDGSYDSYRKCEADAHSHWLRYPHKNLRGLQNLSSSGDYVYRSKNVRCGYFVQNAEDSKYVSLLHSPGTKDCYDYTDWGENAELLYECMSCGYGSSNNRFGNILVKNTHDISYSNCCWTSSYLFGCVGLRNKQYCMLNTQYTKEEYEALVPRIIEHMNAMPYVDKGGRTYSYGEFFPIEFSPFAYNESVAQEHFPLTQGEAERQGFSWRTTEERKYAVTFKNDDIPRIATEIEDRVALEAIFECAHKGTCAHECTMAFKLIPLELAFYKRMNLPLPHLCPRCRHWERLKHRNPPMLWRRKCMCGGETNDGRRTTNDDYRNAVAHSHGEWPCLNEFETSYAPDRPELVYCEDCYQSEVM